MSYVINQAFDKGANNSFSLQVNDVDGNAVDLTTYTINAFYKKHANAYANTIQTLNTTGNANGYLVISMNAATSNSVNWGRFYYYITATNNSSNSVVRLQEGILTIRP